MPETTHRVARQRATAEPYNEAFAKGDLEMAHLTESAGWAPFRDEVIRRQGDLTRRLLGAPARQAPLEECYGLIGEINALAQVLGVPIDIAKRAVAERKKLENPRQESDV